MAENESHQQHGGALTLTPVDQLTIPWGSQQIELHQVDFVSGGMPLLRVRIREGRRFTIFDIDAVSAARWGQAMTRWAATQGANAANAGGDDDEHNAR